MADERTIEVFSAGCPACSDTLQLVERMVCPSCEVTVLDMNDAVVARHAKELGVRVVPAVVVDGELASCCVGGATEEALRAAGIGQPMS